ncbi:metal-dependent phosphohydrolase [Massilia sp. Root418]|uniref:HD-GYP domain-containing protein n=1 Tax=Massilia sp. Root418 TaxID=1736532 RepID=UPI000700E7BE|nr:HD domain-containing phosphohydrolase [Massilia sp. Root418]KQW89842.1 metal-dependent phosphohydrolase [Massilia sp. Root418]
MKIRKISPGELQVGQLLPWDVYGDGGGLLARQGQLVANRKELDSLAERGVVEDWSQALPQSRAPQSVLRLLNGAQLELQHVLQQIAAGVPFGNAQRMLEDIASLVDSAVRLSADVAVASILHSRSGVPYSVRHSVDTAVVAQLVAQAMKKPEEDIRTLTLAALTMNVGMLGEHDRLQMFAGPLGEADRRMLRSHPQTGVLLLRQAGIEHAGWLACVLAHHENEDGSGYPGGKTGAYVPESAKLVALADRYCARLARRRYRPGMTPNAALRELLLEARHTLDGLLPAVLIRELGIYPVGTCVRLANGEAGVVARKGLNATTPWVASLLGPTGAPLPQPVQRDTRSESTAIREVLALEDLERTGWRFFMEQVWGRAAAQ